MRLHLIMRVITARSEILLVKFLRHICATSLVTSQTFFENISKIFTRNTTKYAFDAPRMRAARWRRAARTAGPHLATRRSIFRRKRRGKRRRARLGDRACGNKCAARVYRARLRLSLARRAISRRRVYRARRCCRGRAVVGPRVAADSLASCDSRYEKLSAFLRLSPRLVCPLDRQNACTVSRAR